jgi:hypothetical protein
LDEECRSLSSSLCSFLHSPSYFVPHRLKYSPQHPFSNTLILRTFLNFSDQVSHPYKKQAKL